MSLEEKAKILIEKKGRTKAEALKFCLRYVERKEGREKKDMVIAKLKELGFEESYEKLKPFDWVKEATLIMLYLILMEVLDWSEEDIFKMGEEEPKESFIARILMNMLSIEKVMKEAPKYWRKFYDFASIEPVEIDKEKRFLIIRIHGYDFDPIGCVYIKGFLITLSKFTIKAKNYSIKETKCIHEGEKFHEYIITWE